jgi:hypothetical protein
LQIWDAPDAKGISSIEFPAWEQYCLTFFLARSYYALRELFVREVAALFGCKD